MLDKNKKATYDKTHKLLIINVDQLGLEPRTSRLWVRDISLL